MQAGVGQSPTRFAPLLVLRGVLVYSGYTIRLFGCRRSDLGIRTGIPVIENDV